MTYGGISVANIKSQKKRILTNEKARMRNRAIRSELKTATRSVQDAVAAQKGLDAYVAALKACRLMDKAVTKGVIHKHQAANRKSGIMKLANTVVSAEDIAAYKPAEKKAPVAKGGTKKAAAKAERTAALEAEAKEKAKRREKTEKAQGTAAKKKAEAEAKAAKEAAAAEAAAAKEAAKEAKEEKAAEEAAE
jgi:small subunit ribosomal protein S20